MSHQTISQRFFETVGAGARSQLASAAYSGGVSSNEAPPCSMHSPWPCQSLMAISLNADCGQLRSVAKLIVWAFGCWLISWSALRDERTESLLSSVEKAMKNSSVVAGLCYAVRIKVPMLLACISCDFFVKIKHLVKYI